jgi:hypothetical protein
VGAFALEAGTRDAAVLATLNTGATGAGYSVRLTAGDRTATGLVLAEVYDADAPTAPVQIVNVSTLGIAGTGANNLVSGFVIGGTVSKQLLIRAVGPGLAAFGVTDALADPQFAVTPLGQSFTVASDDNWANSAALTAAFAQAGAFALPPGSKDAALVVRLPPGGYTVTVSGAGSTTGTALVEIYDLDP